MPGPNGEVLVVGPYVSTFNGQPLGIMEGDAGVPTLQQVYKGIPIDNTDQYGKATIDDIDLGKDYFMQMTCMEYKAGSLSALAPWSLFLGRQGVIGALGTSLAVPLVLTAIAGTSAVGSPNTVTANRAKIAPGFQSNLLFGPMVRTVPLRLILLPYVLSGIVIGNYVMA